MANSIPLPCLGAVLVAASPHDWARLISQLVAALTLAVVLVLAVVFSAADRVAATQPVMTFGSTEILGVGPKNTEAPKVTGTATAGQILTASSGKWSGTEPILFEYEWLRCNATGGECTQAAAASLLPTYLVLTSSRVDSSR